MTEPSGRQNVWRTAALWLIGVALSAQLALDHLWPRIYLGLHDDEFRRMTLECEQAMHVHRGTRSAIHSAGGTETDPHLLAADVQMVVCHDYDLLRKRLLVHGVSEDSLSLISLEALEDDRIPLKQLIEPHLIPPPEKEEAP